MRRTVIPLVLAALAVIAAPAVAAPSFTRAANTPTGRAALESGPAKLTVLTDDVWHYTGQDILPFDYEQGIAFAGQGMGRGLDGSLVFTSRGAVIKTTLGCPDPLNDAVACYDEQVRRQFGVSADEFQMGFDHIGDIDVGREGPARGFAFAPLETRSRGGECPRQNRGYKAYRVTDLSTAGRLIETACHRFHSWVTVDPTGRWLLAADAPTIRDDGGFEQVIRLHEIARTGTPGAADEISIVRRQDLDVTITADQELSNYAGCAFRNATAMYCPDWRESNELDIDTRIFRIDFSDPIGTPGATATGHHILFLELEPKYTGVDIDSDGDREPVVPFGNETEGVTFYRRSERGAPEMHILIRGETLGSFYYTHLAPGPPH